jgi:GNAT superfamily N-acetyltransferase
MRVLSHCAAELPGELRTRIEAAIHAEFDHFAIVRETAWAEPDWVYLAYADEDLAAFYFLFERTVRIDGAPRRALGLGNLVTLPAHRGRGVAATLLRQTEKDWFSANRAELALLLCADALAPYYSKLGWQDLAAPVAFAQPAGPRIWGARCMALTPDREPLQARQIDLGGLPW